ncbi:hypothetical protein [Paraburkholderia saeva]|uniref:hypothetical protein n=1 Tax=Paraburkholderia saeva TaxID=2777537 RepID=UPI001D72BCE4|nr:hypothetical protein [Paraburkholderia saeva]CAG4926199.1 hypothetical protein R70241_05448 [Paraburkholderia saeva]
MASAGTLTFDIAADVSRLRTDMGKATKEINSALDSIRKSSAAEAAISGAEFAEEWAKAFSEKIMAAIDQGDAIGKLAQRIGTTTEALSALTYAGGFAGATVDDLTAGFKGMNKSLLDARDPLSEAASAYKSFGLNVAELQRMDPAEAFNEIAEAVSKYADGAQKGAAVNAIFGKSAQVLIPLLDGGKEGLAAAREEAEKLGLIISGSTARAMSEFNDDLDRMKRVSEGAAMQVAERVVPALDELVRAMGDANVSGGAWQQTLKWLGDNLSDLVFGAMNLAGGLSILAKAVADYGQVVDLVKQGQLKEAWYTAGDIEDRAGKAIDNLKAKIGDMQDRQRDLSNNPVDLGRGSDDWGVKKANNFTGAMDAAAAASKKAAKEADVFKSIMESIDQQAAKMVAMGDPFKEFLANPKLQSLPPELQQKLIDYEKQVLDTTDALKLQKAAQDAVTEGQQEALDDEIAAIDAREKFVKATLDSLDPTRQYIENIKAVDDALQHKTVTEKEAIAMEEYFEKRLQDDLSKKSQSEMLNQITDAINQFGKTSSDAFVDFIAGTGAASQSFSQMVSSMLVDIAKMIVYETVFKSMFSGINSGVTGLGNIISSWGQSQAIGRMSGGPVQAGMLYEVNELPYRKEFFIPATSGKIVTDAGAGTGGTPVTINVRVNNDGTSSQDNPADDGRKATELAKRIAAVTRQVIATEKRSGGLLAS